MDTVAGWQEVAKLAPLGTVFIATAATLIALLSLRTQKSIARRRAAIDFFLKIDMDVKMGEAYDKYEQAVEKLDQTTDMNGFRTSDDYEDIIAYLNVHE